MSLCVSLSLPVCRLFGIVNRIAPDKEKIKLICHVLEAQNGMSVRMTFVPPHHTCSLATSMDLNYPLNFHCLNVLLH